AIGLVWFLLDVEAVVICREGIARLCCQAEALIVALLRRLGDVAAEIHVEVLFASQDRAPRRRAAGAVVEHANDARAARVGSGLQALITGSRSGDPEFRVQRGDAARVAAALNHLPALAILADLDDRATMRGELDIGLLLADLVRDVF